MRQGSSRSSFDFCSTNIHPARSTTTSALTDALFCSSSFHYREKPYRVRYFFFGISIRHDVSFIIPAIAVYKCVCASSGKLWAISVNQTHRHSVKQLVLLFGFLLTLAENLLCDGFNGGFLAVFVFVITIYFDFLFKGFPAIEFSFCFVAFRDNNQLEFRFDKFYVIATNPLSTIILRVTSARTKEPILTE